MKVSSQGKFWVGSCPHSEGHRLAYFSKTLRLIAKQCLLIKALLTTVKKWTSNIMDTHFYIKTGHWNLKYLSDHKFSNILQ
ncbi:hypothetical protein DCAR_0518962 [Daucus carota subsp. sativus]|uniref:Reverse transcriptase RNase H-like domain-containing protein n=1 Tax=Daucus carota subsp. sativus TaxID=79200 RepID=A0A164XM33_DAUCS|nr:hypothetical protein DCAR_0518962 [Daucus carota subsp. sativus]